MTLGMRGGDMKRAVLQGAMARRRCASRETGVSMIELLIVVVIVGILATIAIPAYQDYMVKGKRADAKAVLSEDANWLERNYVANGCYNYANVTDCQGQSGTAVVLPFTVSPKSGSANYAVSIAYASSGQQFTLSATPCGNGGAGCPTGSASHTDGDCDVLTLNNLGQQGESGSKDAAYCWQR